MRILFALSFFFCSLIFFGCESNSNSKEKENIEDEPENSGLSITSEPFGKTEDGSVELFTLKNKNEVTIKITNFGGIVVSIQTPDKNGDFADITLGFDSLPGYLDEHPYFGGIIGRYGNRIGKGKFSIAKETYQLATNNEPNHLHGGIKGFDKVLWDAKMLEESDEAIGVELKYTSKDMEEGYPGNLEVTVNYWLSTDNELIIEYRAITDKPTICNLTNHAYFNLTGEGGTILDHELMINAAQFTPVDKTLIPTGEIQLVEGTPFDFREPTPIGSRIETENEQLKYGIGYDHNFVLQREDEEGLELAATVYEPNSGRFLEVFTEEPGIQFYSGNFLDGSILGRGDTKYDFRTGLCLETQHFPDSPNKESFPSVLLEPHDVYTTKTIYRFSVK